VGINEIQSSAGLSATAEVLINKTSAVVEDPADGSSSELIIILAFDTVIHKDKKTCLLQAGKENQKCRGGVYPRPSHAFFAQTMLGLGGGKPHPYKKCLPNG
jgi:hypothetical protein